RGNCPPFLQRLPGSTHCHEGTPQTLLGSGKRAVQELRRGKQHAFTATTLSLRNKLRLVMRKTLIVLFSIAVSGCGSAYKDEKMNLGGIIRLMTLDPGHFHPALVLTSKYPASV